MGSLASYSYGGPMGESRPRSYRLLRWLSYRLFLWLSYGGFAPSKLPTIPRVVLPAIPMVVLWGIRALEVTDYSDGCPTGYSYGFPMIHS